MKENLEAYEETVLGIARHLIRILDISLFFKKEVIRSISDFESELERIGAKNKLMDSIHEFKAPKLGIIICSSEGKKSSNFKDIVQRVIPKNRKFFGENSSWYEDLCYVAYGIIVATMYKILNEPSHQT